MEKSMTFVPVPIEIFEKIKSGIETIEQLSDAISQFNTSEKKVNYLTVREFCSEVRIGRNKYEEIKGQIKSVRVSPRKIMIPTTEIDRWFAGEIA